MTIDTNGKETLVSEIDTTIHAAVLMHEAWEEPEVFLAATREEAMVKAETYAEAMMLEYWCEENDGSQSDWIALCWESGSWTMENAQVRK